MCALARSMCAAKEMSSTTWTWVAGGRSVLSTIVQDLFLAITCLLFYLSEAIYTTSLFYGESKSILFTVGGFNEASVWDQRGMWFIGGLCLGLWYRSVVEKQNILSKQ